MGTESKIGSLTSGNQAGVILIRADDFNMNPVNAVVYCANVSNVHTVFIAGKAKKKGGKLAYENMSGVMTRLADFGALILANSDATQSTH